MAEEIAVFVFGNSGQGVRRHGRMKFSVQEIEDESLADGVVTKKADMEIKDSLYRVLVYSPSGKEDPGRGILAPVDFKKLFFDYYSSRNSNKDYFVVRYNSEGEPVNFKKKDQFLKLFFPKLLS